MGAISAYFALVVLFGDVMAAGRPALGLSAMVGAHFWEHVVDASLIGLIVVAVAGSPAAAAAPARATPFALHPSY